MFSRRPIQLLLPLLLAFASLVRADEVPVHAPAITVTNVNQFWTLPSENYLRGCSFRLTGTVTLLDTNRNLLVLQDATGAVAVNTAVRASSTFIGERILLEGTQATPAVEGFPEYPYHPSGWNIQTNFEAPSNWGDYHLTRMRGYLHPPATGNYTFWIASDNSSELWLSSDEDPAKVRKIAFINEGFWVNPREWSRYPSQRSETIFLRADKVYYLEAFQEQVTQDDHLAVAWQGPNLHQAIIDGQFLTPWIENSEQMPMLAVPGILREFWTNYSAGSLVGMTGVRHFASVLTAENIHLTGLGASPMPEPRRISLDQPLSPEDNYCWVKVTGLVTFLAVNGKSATINLSENNETTQLRILNWATNPPSALENSRAQAQGVCEGTHSMTGPLTPGLIWVPSESNLAFGEPAMTNATALPAAPPVSKTPASSGSDMGGFYVTRGIVTFNDQIQDKHCVFIQDDNGGSIFISDPREHLTSKLQIGEWIQIGGTLLLGKDAPGLQPSVLRKLGWRTMPAPVVGPTDSSVEKIENGVWTEVEGVVRSISPNGIMLLAGKKGIASVWIGGTSTDALEHYVDSTLRIQGVMSSAIFDRPVLLTPSFGFVEVEESAPENSFNLPIASSVNPRTTDLHFRWVHRRHLEGIVTYRDDWGFFLQSASANVRVQTVNPPSAHIGDWVGVTGFPEGTSSLTEALVRSTGEVRPLEPKNLEIANAETGGLGNLLAKFKATLLSKKIVNGNQILELEEGQRVFEAALPLNSGPMPNVLPGSRVEITGVCDLQSGATPALRNGSSQNNSSGSLRVWLRSPADVIVLSGPPWWTWRRASFVVGVLSAILAGTILWIYLLRRRLKRQQAARLSFSKQTLQGQESERRRIAANLHDSLGQNLLVIKNQLHLAMQPVGGDAETQRRLEEISNMASQAIDEVRQITHDLRPYQLDRLGLTQTIRAAVRRVSENSTISFASDVEDIDGLLDKESEIHVYRIIQESINNVVKHSEATEVTIVVKKNLSMISLGIRDNGRGFMLSPGFQNAGFGLTGISERAKILGGNLMVDSRPGAGVSLTIEIPVFRSKNETANQVAHR